MKSTALIARSALSLAVAAAGEARAEPAARTFSLDEAVTEALANHPRIAVARAEEASSEAHIDESRTTILPDLSVSAEINRSTGNTSPGAFFYAPSFVPVAGAPRGKTFDSGVWQTGLGASASWDAVSISRQAADVDLALAGRRETAAATNAERLEVAYRAADAFLLLLEAEATVRAAKASVDRATVLVTMTRPLVDQSLRPGVDLARAEAELAGAQTQIARVEQAREVRRAALTEALGLSRTRVEVEPGRLLAAVPENPPERRSTVSEHPIVVRAAAAEARAGAVRSVVDVQYLPRVDLVAALWLRGSGLYGSPAAGFAPDIPNWAAGVVATWSLLDIPTIRARARVAEASHSAATARRDEAMLAVSGQLANAAAVLEGTVRVARQTPAALASAQAAERQASARYATGLSPEVDVADAQRILAQAEIDDAVARLEIQRAQLLFARASGDLGPFLERARGGGR
jgi:outer membrane protein TolC